jgi:threonine/homoserine/homoserine lactone efflux protein
MLYVLSRSIGQSRNAGLMSAAGLAVGGFVHVVAAALGLAAAFVYLPSLYTALVVFGAIYLVYLGLQMVFEKNPSPDFHGLGKIRRAGLGRIFFQGILVEILNPKTLFFFVAFLPQFVNPEHSSVGLQMLVLGTLVPLTAVPADLIVAFAGGTIARKLAENPTASRLLTWLGAAFLVFLGLRLFIGR